MEDLCGLELCQNAVRSSLMSGGGVIISRDEGDCVLLAEGVPGAEL